MDVITYTIRLHNGVCILYNSTLPDSPPDSEPYSPPDGHPNGLQNGHTNPHSINNNPQNTRQGKCIYHVQGYNNNSDVKSKVCKKEQTLLNTVDGSGLLGRVSNF